MEKQAKIEGKPQEPYYLRRAGREIGGERAYLCSSHCKKYSTVVFATSRDMAKAKVWAQIGAVKFFC